MRATSFGRSYWDVERQRFPAYDHRAVIVAEEITSRFFNVIRLLNRAVPIIALQLNAFTVDAAVVLHFTKVLDVLQETKDDEEEGGEPVDRRDWERKAGPESLAVLDQVVATMVKQDIAAPRVDTSSFYRGFSVAARMPVSVSTTCAAYSGIWGSPSGYEEAITYFRRDGGSR